MLTVGSLFSGVGGIELGLERTGHFKTIWQVEIDDYCSSILKKHWSEVPRWEDIRDFNAMLSAGAFPVRTYLSRERAPAFMENVLVSGGRCYRPFAWYDPSTSSWRTWTRSFRGDWMKFSGPWPRAGMIRNGIAYRRSPLGVSTAILKALFGGNGGIAYSLWPTPTRQDSTNRQYTYAHGNHEMKTLCLPGAVKLFPTPRAIYGEHPGMRDPEHLTGAVRLWPTPIEHDSKSASSGDARKRHLAGLMKETETESGNLNPTFVEFLMGFPPEWTASDASEMPSSPRSPSSSENSSGSTKPGGSSE